MPKRALKRAAGSGARKRSKPPKAAAAKSPRRVILFNKPYNVLSTFTDSEGRKTIGDFVNVKGVYAAGRLDYDSEGLIILTNDGALQSKLSDPKHKTEKTYLVQVEGVPDKEALGRLLGGVSLGDGPTRAVRVTMVEEPSWLWERSVPIRFRKTVPVSWIEVTVTEGRNRLVRRMCAAAGFPVLRLIRVSVGERTLGTLKPGEWAEEKQVFCLEKDTRP
ncbi:MAG: pseudouridine synthase [Deltaproteobacteria bacterium]|nr:pseudouridine synthase [Deltaproteobacteria bacterium]